jgi:hypothetical protein
MIIALTVFCKRAIREKDIASAFFAGLIISLFIGGVSEATLFNNSMFSCLMATCAIARLALHRGAIDPQLPQLERERYSSPATAIGEGAQ